MARSTTMATAMPMMIWLNARDECSGVVWCVYATKAANSSIAAMIMIQLDRGNDRRAAGALNVGSVVAAPHL